MSCLRATSKQKDDRTTVYCGTQYAPLLGVLGRLDKSALGSLGLGLSALWHLASRLYVVQRYCTTLYLLCFEN